MTDERQGDAPSSAAIAEDARKLRDRAAEHATGFAEDQKSLGAERVEHVADALRSSAETLESDERQLAEIVGSAAGQLESFAKSLREKDLAAVTAEVEAFGRRQPAIFMGAAVALGFGLARFAKAAAPSQTATAGASTAHDPVHGSKAVGSHDGPAGSLDPRPAFDPAMPQRRSEQGSLATNPTPQTPGSHLERGV